jgi:hypothetical protein
MPGLNLAATVSLDGAQFQRGLNKVGLSVANFIKSFVVGAVGVYAIQAAIRKTIETAEELVEASRRLDLTVEQLQVMRQAALRARIEFTSLEKAIEGINIAREKALEGGSMGKNFMAAFGKAGITKEMLQSQTGGSLMLGQLRTAVLQHNVADLEASIRKITPGFRNFGEIIPFLKQDFVALEAKMRSLGAIMSGTTATELKIFKDEMGLIGQIISSQLAPRLIDLVEAIITGLANLKGVGSFWMKIYENLHDKEAKGEYNSKNPVAFFENLYKEINRTDRGSAQYEFSGSLIESAKKLQEFRDYIKGLVYAEEHPPKPEEFPETKVNEKKERALKDESNSLIKVGNFLGASRDTIGNLQQQTAQHTAAIVTHTKTTADELKAMHQIFDKHVDKPRDLETIFPTG